MNTAKILVTNENGCTIFHQDVIDRVENKMPKENIIVNLAEFFKILGDPTRVKILWALDQSEMCVCDIGTLIGMTKSAVSHQLRTLKQARLVKSRREGKNIYYSLNDDHVREIFEQGLVHINHKD